MDKSEDVINKLKLAEQYIEKGDFRMARNVLAPLVEKSNPEALFLYSSFSVSNSETEAEFERRRILMLQKAVKLGHVRAAYSLGVHYEHGDLVQRDCNLAAQLFKQSAEGGYPKAKLSYGLDLIYGSNGVSQNKELGFSLIKEAAEAGVPEAFEELSAFGDSP